MKLIVSFILLTLAIACSLSGAEKLAPDQEVDFLIKERHGEYAIAFDYINNLLTLNEDKNALIASSRLVALHPEDARVQGLHGYILYKQGLYDKAIPFLEKSAKAGNASAKQVLVLCGIALKNQALAELYIEDVASRVDVDVESLKVYLIYLREFNLKPKKEDVDIYNRGMHVFANDAEARLSSYE